MAASRRRSAPRLARWLVTGSCSVALLTACAAVDAGGDAGSDAEPAAGGSETAGSGSPAVAEEEVAIPGDGTWRIGEDVEPGVYVAEGGENCEYQWLGDVDVDYLDVKFRGFLARPVAEITAKHGGFRSEGCGSWTTLESYSTTPGTTMPGDGIWLVGEDIVPGTYEGEGGDWCMWQRISAFSPDWDSVIKGGGNRRATVEPGDVGFMTEGCGAWTKID